MTENLENDAILTEIPAREILGKIQRGESVEYDHCIINGDFNLDELRVQHKRTYWKQWLRRRQWLRPPKELINQTQPKASDDDIIIIESTIIGGSKPAKEKECRWVESWRSLWNTLTQEPGEKVVISGPITITNSIFNGVTFWDNVIFEQEVNFEGTVFDGQVTVFSDSEFLQNANFKNTNFRVFMCSDTIFEGDRTYFQGAEFNGIATFYGSKFEGFVFFGAATFFQGAIFDYAQIERDLFILRSHIYENLSFCHVKFNHADVQEKVCRFAKKFEADKGNFEISDYYLFREMQAKTNQKTFYYRIIDFVLMELIFGYGVRPRRIIAAWVIIIFISAWIYWIMEWIKEGETFSDYIYFSTINVATRSSGGYTLVSEPSKWFATGEAIFGTFLWAAFITTFVRKYSR